MRFELYNGSKKLDVEVTQNGENLSVSFEGKRFDVKLTPDSMDDVLVASVDGRDLSVVLEEETESKLRFSLDGRPISLMRAQTHLAGGSTAADSAPAVPQANALVSPLFGKVISVDVKPGDSVDSGQSLLVLEAMKMESVIRADGKHVVKEVLVKEGQGVQKGQPLLKFA